MYHFLCVTQLLIKSYLNLSFLTSIIIHVMFMLANAIELIEQSHVKVFKGLGRSNEARDPAHIELCIFLRLAAQFTDLVLSRPRGGNMGLA